MCHFANPAKNRNPATFWPELNLGRICKNGRFSAKAEIQYSPCLCGKMEKMVFCTPPFYSLDTPICKEGLLLHHWRSLANAISDGINS